MALSARLLTVNSSADAERQLTAMEVDPFTVRSIVPQMVHRLMLIEGIDCDEVELIRHEIVSLGGNAAISGKRHDGDAHVRVVLMGTEKQLRRLSARLFEHPFALHSLAAEIRRLLDTGSAPPASWALAGRTIDLSRRPCVMGVLNVTPDSFSDGSLYSSSDKAAARALEMEAEGADIIDIGGESTRPFARPVDAEEEERRVIPVIELLAGRLKVPISIDTYKSSVAEKCLAAGAEIVNDISAMTFDERMLEVVAAAGAGLVLMHTRGRPEVMQRETGYCSIVSDIFRTLSGAVARAEAAGVPRERLVVDPGIGFGKSVQGNLEILHRLAEFSSIGCPVMVGTSRKSFIGQILGRETGDRLFGTAATLALALANGASVFRVHDVKEMRDVLDMSKALCEASED